MEGVLGLGEQVCCMSLLPVHGRPSIINSVMNRLGDWMADKLESVGVDSEAVREWRKARALEDDQTNSMG